MDVKQEQFDKSKLYTQLFENLQKTGYASAGQRIKTLQEYVEFEITDMQQIQLLNGQVEDFKKCIDFKDKQGRNIVFYALWSESIAALDWIFEAHKDLIESYTWQDQPPDLKPGINTVIADSVLPTTELKSIPLLRWLLDILIVGKESKGDKISIFKHILLYRISANNWLEALELLQTNFPDYIQSYGKVIINNSIKGKRYELFHWATKHLFEQLMEPAFFAKAISYGMLEAVNWFIANAPKDILDHQSANGTTILHLAASSQSNKVFKFISELKSDSIYQRDKNGAGIVEYALNSFKAHRLNEALKLCKNSRDLHIMRTPKRFENDWDYTCLFVNNTFYAMIINDLLACNLTLQIIHDEFNILSPKAKDSAQLMMERNKIITQFEQLKPIIILLLCISREQEILRQIPFELIQEIVKYILPGNVPQTTVNLYRDNFFFNSIQHQNPCYEEDSQEECNIGSDSDTEYCMDFN